MKRSKRQEAGNKTLIKTHDEFIQDLIKLFPEIEEDILDEDNMDSITLQMIEFKVFTQKAIDNNDLSTVKKCFDFINEQFNGVEYRVKNALAITYLWHLKITPNSSVERLLSTQLKDIIKGINTNLTS